MVWPGKSTNSTPLRKIPFRKDWKPDIAGGPITAAERQSIKDSLAKIFRQELKKEIEGGGYPVVNTPESDVLRIRAEIRDLYINAPDVPRAGLTRLYALSAGDAAGSRTSRFIDGCADCPSHRLEARPRCALAPHNDPRRQRGGCSQGHCAVGQDSKRLDAAHTLKQ